ncbi:helix-turn-helix domain-containing protein [Aureimonas sp. AU40]|uniref:helix-turn-helix domain-containing protein n=1 Tax=Aureimonas sp. AU40 TaxID=1637747 RepID=UPI0007822E02|nr:helix-turn-helix transcriptional regulator [Aureimonas sp. AU40]
MSATPETATETLTTSDPNLLNRQIFGSFMRRLRSDADMTRAEFARRIGCSGPLISQTESGVNTPNKRVEDMLVGLYPYQESEIRLLAAVARLSSGTHADDFQLFVRATSARAA